LLAAVLILPGLVAVLLALRRVAEHGRVRRRLHDVDDLHRRRGGVTDAAERAEDREHRDRQCNGSRDASRGRGQARGTCPPLDARGEHFNELRGCSRAQLTELVLDWRGATASKEIRHRTYLYR